MAKPEQIQLLADEYRRAAQILLPTGRRGKPLSRAPFRLSAIHAIELYLNAFLLYHHHEPFKLRGLQHNLAARTELALHAGLKLRKRTISHLKDMHEGREYLVTRYSPELSTASHLNRLNATLDEIARKVRAGIQIKPAGESAAKDSGSNTPLNPAAAR